MRLRTHFRPAAFHATIILALAYGMTSCSNNRKPEDPKEVAEDHNDAKFDDRSKEKDAQFLVNAAEINLGEIQLGQLAQRLGTTPNVKELGKTMEDTHNKAMGDLKGLAEKKQITIPTSPTDGDIDTYTKLSEKSGKDFDKAYCDMMVDGHEKAIKKFEDASANASDAEIRTWAGSMLPVLRNHLDNAMTCRKKCENRM